MALQKASDISILFVCLGNICRSPLGEGVCRRQVEERSLSNHITIDSCGTGSWHVGEPPHRESRKIALKHGIDISEQRARQLRSSDVDQFTHFVAMDQSNRSDMREILGSEANIFCLREFDPEQSSLDVPDPYYGGPDGFLEVFQIIDRSVEQLLDKICEEYGIG